MKYRIKETGNTVFVKTDTDRNILSADQITYGFTIEEIKPEARKLWAYYEQTNIPNSFTNNVYFLTQDLKSSNRAPEYDILYPKEGV